VAAGQTKSLDLGPCTGLRASTYSLAVMHDGAALTHTYDHYTLRVTLSQRADTALLRDTALSGSISMRGQVGCIGKGRDEKFSSS